MAKNVIEISTNTILKIVFIGLALLLLYLIRDILGAVFLAIVIASAISPFTDYCLRYKIPRVLSALFIYFIFAALLALVLYLFIPALTNELKLLSETIPGYYEKVFADESLRYLGILRGVELILENLGERLAQLTTSLFNITSGIFGGALLFLSIIVISFYFSVREKEIERFLSTVAPKEHAVYILDLWKRTQKRLSHWLQGQLFLAFIVGSFVFIGLSLLGIKYPLLLALLAGLLEIFPIVGPILAAIPAIILALFQSPWLALAVVMLYTVIQQVEGNLIVPLVFRKVMGLNPVIVIIALLIGAKLGGIMGILVAVPLAAALGEFLRDFSKRILS